MNDSNFRSIYAEYREAEQKLRASLCDTFLAQPQNPKIQNQNESPRCFTMSVAEIGLNLSPEYHDWQWQWNKLAQLLNKEPHFMNAVKRLRDVAQKRQLKEGFCTWHLHPTVCQSLIRIMNEYGLLEMLEQGSEIT